MVEKNMASKFTRLRLALIWLFGVMIASALAACTEQLDHRGYIAKPGVFNSLNQGMSKLEVEGTLGSPSTTASINFQGDSYYYISSVTSHRAVLNPVEIDRQVIAVRFDRQERVSGVAQYGLVDGKVIDLNTRKTPIVGSEFSLLAELLKGPGTGSTGNFLKKKL